ncbi:MAG: hypothetical protein PHW62_01545 [Candidatus Ratteibacteria bacterium]|nr:hypothetical protein [Candidatus Ratteibacteria bacterium]
MNSSPNIVPSPELPLVTQTLMVSKIIDAMNTEQNNKLLSNLIKHPQNISMLTEIISEDNINILNTTALDVTIRGNHGELLKEGCYIVDKGFFPPESCNRINSTEFSLYYNDVEFVYQNQELIASAMQDGNISSYEMSKLITSRAVYELSKPPIYLIHR